MMYLNRVMILHLKPITVGLFGTYPTNVSPYPTRNVRNTLPNSINFYHFPPLPKKMLLPYRDVVCCKYVYGSIGKFTLYITCRSEAKRGTVIRPDVTPPEKGNKGFVMRCDRRAAISFGNIKTSSLSTWWSSGNLGKNLERNLRPGHG
jgi:hypothetical protein